jgi:hypothetical protein
MMPRPPTASSSPFDREPNQGNLWLALSLNVEANY